MGVVGAVERMADALERQVGRRNAESRRSNTAAVVVPGVDEEERGALRLAAMFHDLGHGPFSHAIEPVLEVVSPLGGAPATDDQWRAELQSLGKLLKSRYSLNSPPATSEVVAVMIVVSEAVTDLLGHGLYRLGDLGAEQVQERIIAAIIGGVDGPGVTHLSTIISGQVDADRLDFLARDAHHSGLEIGFDTERLLSKLEVLQVRDDNLEGADNGQRARIASSENKVLHQIGIAASGYGSLEQMLIGRTFLYDRLYHHHKVRAAEAMAQRMLLVAERDRGRRFSLNEIFLSVGDDTFLRVIAGEVTHSNLSVSSAPAARLANGILQRDLLHRAFAFRGRFIAAPPGLSAAMAESNRDAQWGRIIKDLAGLQARFDLGREIHSLAVEIAETLAAAGIEAAAMGRYGAALEASGPEQLIVDLPGRKAGAIRILARYPDGTLRVPEFSFNPQKWADAYDLQKRTGYVFCPKDVVPVVALASRIQFLRRFGVVMAKDADGYIKAGQAIDRTWLDAMVAANLIDLETASLLTSDRHSLLRVRSEDLAVPDDWIAEDPDFAAQLTLDLNTHLRGGLMVEGRDALRDTLKSIWRFIDGWYSGGRTSQDLGSEAELQRLLIDHLRATVTVEEGTEVAGGEIDLLVERQVVIENKFQSRPSGAAAVAKFAGIQGRRYGLALASQLVIVIAARKVPAGAAVPSKTQIVKATRIAEDRNRVEIRIDLPFGAPVPSKDKSASIMN